jgi:tRNA threonylcarbamoyladenosine modification (KEOPS) complex Cgi121 subunit
MEGENLRAYARAYLCDAGSNPEEVKRKIAGSPGGWVVQTAAEGAATNEFFVEMLAAQTIQAEASGSLLAKSPEMDLLLRLAGTTQISRAIREKGSWAGKPFLLVVAGGRRPAGIRGMSRRELPRRELSKNELRRVEKAALLSAQKG